MQRTDKIRAYDRAFRFGVAVYRFCKLLPKEETYGISAQLRRAVVSISTNIAEEYASGADYAWYLSEAIGISKMLHVLRKRVLAEAEREADEKRQAAREKRRPSTPPPSTPSVSTP